jgi:hypothetical protein
MGSVPAPGNVPEPQPQPQPHSQPHSPSRSASPSPSVDDDADPAHMTFDELEMQRSRHFVQALKVSCPLSCASSPCTTSGCGRSMRKRFCIFLFPVRAAFRIQSACDGRLRPRLVSRAVQLQALEETRAETRAVVFTLLFPAANEESPRNFSSVEPLCPSLRLALQHIVSCYACLGPHCTILR